MAATALHGRRAQHCFTIIGTSLGLLEDRTSGQMCRRQRRHVQFLSRWRHGINAGELSAR